MPGSAGHGELLLFYQSAAPASGVPAAPTAAGGQR